MTSTTPPPNQDGIYRMYQKDDRCILAQYAQRSDIFTEHEVMSASYFQKMHYFTFYLKEYKYSFTLSLYLIHPDFEAETKRCMATLPRSDPY